MDNMIKIPMSLLPNNNLLVAHKLSIIMDVQVDYPVMLLNILNIPEVLLVIIHSLMKPKIKIVLIALLLKIIL